MYPRESPHRLDRRLYVGNTLCAFTCCISEKQPLFTSDYLFSQFETKLLNSLQKHHCNAHVFLFMPDHLHLLLEGTNDQADLWRAVVDFKQQTGYWLAQNSFPQRWQKDFYDHILRRDEDVLKQVAYILNNPVRAGLAKDWKDYPYKGSTMYDLDTLEL